MIVLHPFGDPQTLDVAVAPADPATVVVTWKVGAADDLTLLGVHLGVLPDSRVMLDGAIQYDAADAETVARAPSTQEYLLEHIDVLEPGCEGRVQHVGDLVEEGAAVAFTCDQPLSEVAVRSTTLTDLHPAYRALATGPGGQRAAYAQDTDTHTWSLDAVATPASAAAGIPTALPGTDAGASAAVQIGAVLGAVVLLLVLGGLLGFLLRRRRQAAPDATA